MVINNNVRQTVRDFKICIGSETLTQVPSMKYLGVVIDERLNWLENVTQVTKKFNIINARLRKLRNVLPLDLRIKLYNTMCVPVIDYAATIWGGFSQDVIHKMSRLEHIAARTLSGNYDFINIRGKELMYDLKMSHFTNRNHFNLSLMTFKAIHGLVPDHIANAILLCLEVNQRYLRSFDNMNLYKPKPHCERFKNAFCYAGPTKWNDLPLLLKESPTVNVFKSNYKSMFPLHVDLV